MMSRIRYYITIACVALGMSGIAQGEGAEKRPNILFIPIDDLRIELGCYGNDQIITPNIDRLAESGTLFERAYCQVPVCGASRASLMTGLYPTRERFVTYYTKAEEDAAGIVDLPGWFKANSYTTISNGKIYHHATDNAASWDEMHKPKDFRVYLLPENQGLAHKEQVSYEAADVEDNAYHGGALAEKIIGDIRRAKEEGTPFFITAGFTKPHLPFNAPKKYWDMYDPETLTVAENQFIPEDAPREAIHNWGELRGYGDIPDEGPLPEGMDRILTHGYYASTTYTDAMVGKVLDELDRLEMRDNTIIILFGDHGWQLGEHTLWCKHALFKTSLHAPMMISAPGMKQGQRTSSLVEFVDIYPTLCELAGLDMPTHLQGKSMVPLLENPEATFKEAVYGRYHGGEAVKTDRFQYASWTSGARMLYDHQKDPDENKSIANNPEYQQVVERMEGLLETHRESLKRSRPAVEHVIETVVEPSGNKPPRWKSALFEQKGCLVGDAYASHVNWRVSDPDGDALTYTKLSGPGWLTMGNPDYGRIEGTPTADDAGMNTFTLSVSDGVNPPVEATMKLNVKSDSKTAK